MVPPWFTTPSRNVALESAGGSATTIRYSCAMTGTPVAAYARALAVGAQLRDHVHRDLPYPFPAYPGSLCRIFTPTLLFIAFVKPYFVLLGKSITSSTPVVNQRIAQNINRESVSPSRFYTHYWSPAFSPRCAFRADLPRLLVTRRSRATAKWVPRDWNTWTMTTKITTDT